MIRLHRYTRALLVVAILSTNVAASAASVSAGAQAATVTGEQGKDLYHLDTDTLHFVQTPNGHTDVQFFNSPIGIPSAGGWHIQQPSLSANQPAQTAALPFSLQVGAIGGAAHWATLSTGDKALSIDPLAVDGQAPVAASPTLSGDLATYPGVTASGAILALRRTVSGLVVESVIHSNASAGNLTLKLSLGGQATATEKPDGTIAIESPEQGCGSTGCDSFRATDFLIQPAIVGDGAPGAPTGSLFRHATYSLTASGPGAYQLAVRIDSAWLHDARRVLPVTLDVPVVTAAASDKTGIVSTVSSCAPTDVDPSAQLVVGTVGACTYHGVVSFDAATLPFQAELVSATLNLYTNDGNDAESVEVVPNQPAATLPPPPRPWVNPNPAARPAIISPPPTPRRVTAPPLPSLQLGVLPSWSTAPAMAPSAAAIPQSGSDSYWKRWDVTDLVRSWIQNRWTNTGVTLVSAAPPVTFLSPLGAGANDPATAAYLDVTYNWAPEGTPGAKVTPRAMTGCPHLQNPVRAPYCDGASTIYGVAGVMWPDGFCKGAYACVGGGVEFGEVSNLLAGGYTRVPALNIPCAGFSDPSAFGALYASMKRSLADGLIPIVTFNQENPPTPGDPNCQPDWFPIMEMFVLNMPDMTDPTFGANPPMYFELGNEENCGSSCGSRYSYSNYSYDFAEGATGMNYAFQFYTGGRTTLYTNFHILTGGVITPTAALQGCGNSSVINNMYNAMIGAEYDYYYPVSLSHLGAAVHPYGYATNEGGYWENYGHPYITACADLNSMIVNWTGYFAGMPIVMTEINYTSVTVPPVNNTLEGMYLIDLFTWLYDHLGYQYTISYPIRMLWYTGADPNSTNSGAKNLGIFTYNPSPPPYGSSGDKTVGPIYCPTFSSYPYPYWFQPIRYMYYLFSSHVLAQYPYGACY